MDSLQLSELQSFLDSNGKGEPLSSKRIYIETDCTPLDNFLDPAMDRALDFGDFVQFGNNRSNYPGSNFSNNSFLYNNNFHSNNHFNKCHNFSAKISTDFEDQHPPLPQLVLDATALVHEEKYPGEGQVFPPTVVNFVEQNQSPEPSDATSYYSDDSSSAPHHPNAPDFNQLTSPRDLSSRFQWPSTSVPMSVSGMKADDIVSPCSAASCDVAAGSSFSSVTSPTSSAFPCVTSPTSSIPSPASTCYSVSSPGTPGSSSVMSGRGRRPHGSVPSCSSGKSRRRQVEKGSSEYAEKRARNNIAVRKSRAKAKERQRDTESRVKGLLEHNDHLQKKVDLLSKELTVLKGLFVNIGASLPDDLLKLLGDS